MLIDKQVVIRDHSQSKVVRKALEDLIRDFRKVLNADVWENGTEESTLANIPCLKVGIQKKREPETFVIEVKGNEISIRGADELGAIYGIYDFSHRFLGVDPLWFWKGVEPEAKQAVELPEGTVEGQRPRFEWRGWFVNDEDLLTEWHEGGGPRYIRYPYYAQVIAEDVAEMIFEAALRCQCNMIIPASFLDIMNASERRLVELAVARGLYVSQHHIEPLGVSHFGFENYWAARGEDVHFSYSADPERVRATWRAYAQRWVEVAGDRVIWQLGLRGKGDRAIWCDDGGVTPENAGGYISQALADQVAIVRETDRRSEPLMTTTLWLEGARLMAEGKLSIPPKVHIIFSDYGPSQRMQEDFHTFSRTGAARCGLYYHIAYWMRGPHMVQGTVPERVLEEYAKVLAKGDTWYSIINVCNIREHTLGIQVVSELCRGESDLKAIMRRWAPAPLPEWNRAFLENLIEFQPDTPVQDGDCKGLLEKLLAWIGGDEVNPAPWPLMDEPARMALGRRFLEAADGLAKVQGGVAESLLPAQWRAFGRFQILVQGCILENLYRACGALLTSPDRDGVQQALAALARLLDARTEAEQGRWANWYRGDRKENWPKLHERLQLLLTKLDTKSGEALCH
ncbi:MAG: hypothetical protein D6820_03615 [Lentisphaerae bacterium]|nr:MAG: hypothetical protein D6820_03615 [Lentisphaerota bacterium]